MPGPALSPTYTRAVAHQKEHQCKARIPGPWAPSTLLYQVQSQGEDGVCEGHRDRVGAIHLPLTIEAYLQRGHWAQMAQ